MGGGDMKKKKEHPEIEIVWKICDFSLNLDEAADQLATITQQFLDRFPAAERQKRLRIFYSKVNKYKRTLRKRGAIK